MTQTISSAWARQSVWLTGFVACVLTSYTSTTSAFEWSATGRPEVTRQAIAGLWRLKPQPTFPIKEFTVYPKKQSSSKLSQQQELLLMLKEDGSFQQYFNDMEDDDDDEDNEQDVSTKWRQFLGSKQKPQAKSSSENTARTQSTGKTMPQPSSTNNAKDPSESLTQELVKGVWDYRDGKLILAADRPDEKEEQLKAKSDGTAVTKQLKEAQKRRRQYLDKLIVGRVKISYETSLQDNPILNLGKNDKNQTSNQATSTEVSSTSTEATAQPENSDEAALDAHLSVPKGSLKVGKFFYPKHHPSFFEQPIYNPVTLQPKYELKQVLGALNTQQQQQEDDLAPDKFVRSDFYNKTFLLTSHPLPQSPMYKKWIAKYQEDNKLNPNLRDRTKVNPFAESSQIRVMQVRFFPNNTFATVGGVGGNILRGRFDTFTRGTQFWMQVSRFGIGRSVSGSVYSEGRTLTHEDAKTYWGTMEYRGGQNATANATTPTVLMENEKEDFSAGIHNDHDPTMSLLLEVKGSVLYGTGLTAEPVGRFLMREMEKEELVEMEEDEEDEDDEEDDEDDDYILDEALGTSLPSTLSFDEPDNDRSSDDDENTWDDTNAFQ